MAKRTIEVDLDHASGRTTVTVNKAPGIPIGRVSIKEVLNDDSTGVRWEVRGAGDRQVHRYSSLETAFRNAMQSAVEVVSEDLLPTKTR